MAAGAQFEEVRIGETLKRARTRAGLDIRTAEERTKIRIKYLRALESENWEAIPSPAYAKGFLRTYAGVLGLDPDALVDDYRRQVESALPTSSLRRLPGASGARSARFPLLAAIAFGALGAIVILAILGGSGDNSGERAGGGHRQHGKGHGTAPAHHSGAGARTASRGPVELKLHAINALELCLVAGDGRVLIDSQTRPRGARDGPFEAKSYRLDLETGGAVQVKVGGRKHLIRSSQPVSFQLRGGRARPLAFRGPGCP